MRENIFDGDAESRFLSAFEGADVLCPELSSAGSVNPLARGRIQSDWALVFGAKAADLLSRPRLPQPPSALLHPSLAAEFFERLLSAGADRLVGDEPSFLDLAQTIYRDILWRHCLGECSLPLSFRYANHPSDTPRRYLLRSSHVLEGEGRLLAGLFESAVITCDADVPAAIASVALSYFRAPLERMLETVSPDIPLYPGNFLLQPLVSVRQAGVLQIITSKRAAAWVWQVSLDEGNPRAITSGETTAHIFQGRGRDALRSFFSHFDSLAVALEDYAPGGQDLHIEWGVDEHDQLIVLRWRESPCADPGFYGRAPAQDAFPAGAHALDGEFCRAAHPLRGRGIA